jgi:hypothetical protein
LIAKHKITKKNRSRNNEKLNNSKVIQYCKNFGDTKKRISGFSKSIALLEMQSYIARQDWKHALNLLFELFEYPIELEPLVWRYLFIILLHANDPSHLQKFFEQCVLSENLNNGLLLEKLLLLPSKEI